MSFEETKPRRPARPPAQFSSLVQPCRPAPPPPTAVHAKTSSPSRGYPASPLYTKVLSAESPAKAGIPARPAPPVPRRPILSRGEQFNQSTETEVLGGVEEPPVIKNAGCCWNDISTDATGAVPLYEDVLPNKTELNNSTAVPTPLPVPPRPLTCPRPLSSPRPPVARPRRPFLSQSVTEEPAEHLYEYIPDVLPDTVQEDEGDNVERDVCTADRKPGTPRPLRSWSEQSSVDGDCSAKELAILLEWWRSVEGWETLAMGDKGQESVRVITLVVHRVKMAMRLYQLLVFRHGRILLNHITELHCTADSVSRVGKNTRIAGITGGTTGAVGAAAVVAGIALAPFTFGASMVAAGIGVGVAAAGGVTGASAAITNKVKSNMVRSKVERILRNCRINLEDIVECLEFVNVGMERLRNSDCSNLKHLDTCALKIVKMAQEMDSFYYSDAISRCSSILLGFASGMDSYFSEEDELKLKKGSEIQFADKIREVADRLKESMDELVQVKNKFRLIVDCV